MESRVGSIRGNCGRPWQAQPKERDMTLVRVDLPSGMKVSLSVGGQNELVKKIIEGFAHALRLAASSCTWAILGRSSDMSNLDTSIGSESRSTSTARCRMWLCILKTRAGSS